MEGCRKRKVEICSVRKNGAAGVCWPADAGMEGTGGREVCGSVKK